jgi:protease-4
MIEAVAGMARLARDPHVEGVIFKMGMQEDLGFGNAHELRQGILSLRAAGKKVAVLLTAAGDAEYYVASAADRVWTTRGAPLLVNGLSANVLFFGGTLRNVGVEFEAVRIGAYKTAPNQLTSEEASEEQKEVTSSLLDSVFGGYVAEVSASRRLDPAAFRAALDVGVLPASLAQEMGLVDEIVYPDQLEEAAGRLTNGSPRMFDTSLRMPTYDLWGPPPTIAIVPVEGLIAMGRSGGDPFGFVSTAGADTVVEALEQAARDPGIAAIVLRVDSGGGDAQASDLIWRAVRQAAEKKPVIASMGDVAASGGYYAAAGARRIFATPTTITGSIGIFAMKPAVKGLLQMIDAGVHRASRGERADIFNVFEPWTEKEREAMQGYIGASYRDFLEAVAQGRPLTVEQVDAVGQGRVWTGEQALQRKLVDEMGGLAEALARAAAEAGIAADLAVEYRILAPEGGLFQVGAPGAKVPAPVREVVKAVVPEPLLVEDASGVWAYLPWEITID